MCEGTFLKSKTPIYAKILMPCLQHCELALGNNLALCLLCFKSAFSSLANLMESVSKHIAEALSRSGRRSDYYVAQSALADQCTTNSFSANTSKMSCFSGPGDLRWRWLPCEKPTFTVRTLICIQRRFKLLMK